MASLDFLHNNPVFEQNTRLSRMFSGEADDYSTASKYFSVASNDPFANAVSDDFSLSKYRAENSLQSLQNDFEVLHNQILNIEPQPTPTLYSDEVYKPIVAELEHIAMGEPAIVDQPVYADEMTYFDAASGEIVSFTDLGKNMPETAPDIAKVLASDDLFTIKSEAIYEIAMPQEMDYAYDYKQIVMDNLLQDMNVGSWENMVLHNPADLDYALANNDPLNNVLSEDIILNDDGYSGLHSDLQNLTSY